MATCSVASRPAVRAIFTLFWLSLACVQLGMTCTDCSALGTGYQHVLRWCHQLSSLIEARQGVCSPEHQSLTGKTELWCCQSWLQNNCGTRLRGPHMTGSNKPRGPCAAANHPSPVGCSKVPTGDQPITFGGLLSISGLSCTFLVMLFLSVGSRTGPDSACWLIPLGDVDRCV